MSFQGLLELNWFPCVWTPRWLAHTTTMCCSLWLFFIILLFYLSTGSVATIKNVTVDDDGLDPISGSGIIYGPEENFSQGQICNGCLAKPTRKSAHNGTWHDTTFDPAYPTRSTPRNITFEFNGQWSWTHAHWLLSTSYHIQDLLSICMASDATLHHCLTATPITISTWTETWYTIFIYLQLVQATVIINSCMQIRRYLTANIRSRYRSGGLEAVSPWFCSIIWFIQRKLCLFLGINLLWMRHNH